jgi:preprotein translocase subunit SecA
MPKQSIKSQPLPDGLDALWDRGLEYCNQIFIRPKAFLQQAEKVVALENDYSKLSQEQLQNQAANLRQIFRINRDTPDILNRAFALIREVAYRQLQQKPFRVQVAAALAMNRGCIAELATGEGKTLAAAMAVVVNAWRGKGCHVITFNDYLAKRDAESMADLYRFCGLHVAYIEGSMPPEQRRHAYNADITYCTNKEAVADFLRDQLQAGSAKGLTKRLRSYSHNRPSPLDNVVQRGLYFAIVDEADSILIDEAVTPLIISAEGAAPQHVATHAQAAGIVSKFDRDTHYRINPQYRQAELTLQGKQQAHDMSDSLGSFWKGQRRREEIITQAIIARELYQRDKHYVVDHGRIIIVDESTGRLMPDRTWRNGMHQAIEAKENVEINPPRETLARLSFQRFFRTYKKLAGMTGTAQQAAHELWQVYRLPVVPIPTNKPCLRKILPPLILPTMKEKQQRILQEVLDIHKTGRPVLIGTKSIISSKQISDLLRQRHLPHQVLNAVNHEQEAAIVAAAGQQGHITVATNMAGRGTDIKLGRGVASLGGLHVIAAEANESTRIDRQLYGRAARQGDPGSVRSIISLEDELANRYGKNMALLLQKIHPKTNPGKWTAVAKSFFRYVCLKAETTGRRQRKEVLRTDQWLDEHLGFSGKPFS